jgi:hypothetical protein
MHAQFLSFFAALISILQFPLANALASCNLFPKIIGGSLGDTLLYSVDANQVYDVLAVGGQTYDSGLAGTTLLSNAYVPLIAVFSISSTIINWMKVDQSKLLATTVSISLSPNGMHLIAKLVIWSTNKPYI